MELSNEDSLRLNVLMTQQLQAVRIDESAMVVYALTGSDDQFNEAKVALNPTCGDDKYLKWIRELLSTHALGSPGGYPVFLKRWTRMGQAKDESLESLLLLGEPEAVVAVAHAPGLSESVARKTWWAMPTADVARKILEKSHIAQTELGRELAAYLLEFLPFEEEPKAIVESVRLVLQAGLISEEQKQGLWRKAGRKSAFYIGFLLAQDAIPQQQSPHALHGQLRDWFEQHPDNVYAQGLNRLLSAAGQSYLDTLDKAIGKLANQEATVLLVQAITDYFAPLGLSKNRQYRENAEIAQYVESILSQPQEDLQHLVQSDPLGDSAQGLPGTLQAKLGAMLNLALLTENILNPIFSQTDAVGSVMRKRLAPVFDPVLAHIKTLRCP